jgi:WD40 repeat protein
LNKRKDTTTAPKWFAEIGHMVNSVAISGEGLHMIAGSYYFPYPGTTSNQTAGTYGAYGFDSQGNRLWADEFAGNEGIYAVAISGDGRRAAAGGMLKGGKYGALPTVGVLRAYDAQSGHRLLDAAGIPMRINSVALSDDGAVLVAATKRTIYVFAQTGSAFPVTPATPFAGGNNIESVAVAPDGTWFASCDMGGNVYLGTIANGTVLQTYTWTAPQTAIAKGLITVGISRADSFVVGGDDVVYLFTKAAMIQGAGPTATFHPPGAARKSVRWVAISDDGRLITVVVNQQQAGLLIALSAGPGGLTKKWQAPLDHNPNSTNIDSAAQRITAADGYPDNQPGTFYLFDAGGNKVWEFPTKKMNWPIAVNAAGTAIAAGSDNGNVYYFRP